MREGFVRVRHSVRVVFLLYRVAAVISGIQNLVSKPVGHRLLATPARVPDEPSDRKAVPARLLVDFDRHLISRSTYAARLDLNAWLHVVDGLLESLQRVLLRLFMDLLHRVVK